MAASLNVSVVVCTYNRADDLAVCLRSLVTDTSRVAREIVVVDNGSTDGTADVIKSASSREEGVRYIFEGRRGKPYALNAGIASANGSIVAFTDDDVSVCDGWVDALVAPFADPRVGATGGRIQTVWPYPPPTWLRGLHADHIGLHDLGPDPCLHDASRGLLPVGANMAVRTEILREHKPPFEVSLGPGLIRLQFEETLLGMRIAAEGHLMPYVPEALVRHRVRPERINWEWIRRSFAQSGYGSARFERLHGKTPSRVWPPRRLVQAARVVAAARAVRRRNAALTVPTADDALREFGAYGEAGKYIERAFVRYPTVGEWVVKRLG